MEEEQQEQDNGKEITAKLGPEFRKLLKDIRKYWPQYAALSDNGIIKQAVRLMWENGHAGCKTVPIKKIRELEEDDPNASTP